MNPRRLHSDTIFSITGFSFRSAMRRAVFLNPTLMSRNGEHLPKLGRAVGAMNGGARLRRALISQRHKLGLDRVSPHPRFMESLPMFVAYATNIGRTLTTVHPACLTGSSLRSPIQPGGGRLFAGGRLGKPVAEFLRVNASVHLAMRRVSGRQIRFDRRPS